MDTAQIPWPLWMIDFVASNNITAFETLVRSVGGSPPYGNVDPGEARMVHHLLDEYHGPKRASNSAIAAIKRRVAGRRDAQLALEAFAIHDRIASEPDDYTEDDVLAGLRVAEQLEHIGLSAYFTLLHAGLYHREGDFAAAKRLSIAALESLCGLIPDAPVYQEQVGKAIINATSFSLLDGDLLQARAVYAIAEELGLASLLAQQAAVLEHEPVFGDSLAEMSRRASDYLEDGDPLAAIEWYTEAERFAVIAGDNDVLANILGDLGVAYRRIGNNNKAIIIYGRAIDYATEVGNDLSVARWSGNLGSVLLDADDLPAARRMFSDAAKAATRSGSAEQVSIAAGNLAASYAQQGRYAEAVEQMDAAVTEARSDPKLLGLWRGHRVDMLSLWGEELLAVNQYSAASGVFQRLVAFVDWAETAELQAGVHAYKSLAVIAESKNDTQAARAFLEEATAHLDESGDVDQLEGIRKVLTQME